VDSGRLSEETLHGELGEIVAGRKPGREAEDERILLWHRGLATADVAVGALLYERAVAQGAGTALPYRGIGP
jgi:ornithine cyclodeaminase